MLFLGCLFPVPAIAQPIALCLANSAGVPERILSRAEGVAGHILQQAGISVAWPACAEKPACPTHPDTVQFRMLILNQRPLHTHGDVAGFALIVPPPKHGYRYAGVFYPIVEEAAHAMEVDPALLLGATMAHEIGHILLGTGSHSPKGVMSAHLGRQHILLADHGELLFNPDQARQLKSEAAARAAARASIRP